MDIVGKKTPVWRNRKTGGIVCRETIREALGLSWPFPVSSSWESVTSLPAKDRVVIDVDGTVLPRNELNEAIVLDAKIPGVINIYAYGREYSCYVQYLDSVRVVIS